MLTGTCNIAAFLAAAVIPIPALRAFALQAAILIAFNLASMLLIFPAFMAMDLRRVVNKRVDILCCYDGSHDEDEITDLDTVDPRRYYKTPKYKDIFSTVALLFEKAF